MFWSASNQGSGGSSFDGLDNRGLAFTAGGVDYRIYKPSASTNTFAYQSNGTNGQATTLNSTTACFCTGTLIRTVRGEIAIEELRVGDVAVTASGAHRPIRWIGHSVLTARPGGGAVDLVRITTGALGENRPTRDLVVTPAHAIALDVMGEVLIPADKLVNGATILRETVERVTVWHVELDSHDLILAEGQPAESFLDMGNRSAFAGEAVVDLALHPDGDPRLRTHADFCRPYHADGPFVAVARTQLRRRTHALGWRLGETERFDGVHLEVDGKAIRPETRGLSARFMVPADAADIWLVSPTTVPHDIGDSPDGRALGLYLAGLGVDDGWGAHRAVALDDPRLADGFHEVEPGRRWTAGRARLPAALFEGLAGTVLLRIDIDEHARQVRWVAPSTADDAALERETLAA